MAAEEVREACLQLLAVRPRSRAELAQRLQRRGFAHTDIEPVLDRLSEVDLIDDAAFARTWVRSRHAYSGRGRRALAAELQAKGIDPAVRRLALAEVDDVAEEQRARDLVRKRMRSLTSRPGTAEQAATITRKLLGMLARRGYAAELAHRVIRDELGLADAE